MLLKDCGGAGGLATHHSEADRQAKLVERKICFISDASNQVGLGEGGTRLSKGWLHYPSSHWQALGQELYKQKVGRVGTELTLETVVSSDKSASDWPLVVWPASSRLFQVQ